MNRFEQCLKHILQFEGGYVNHPADRGNATNYGITQRVYNAWNALKGPTLESVERIDQGEVRDIYRERYWDACRCDDLPQPLDMVVFDTAIQHGVSRAIKWLQKQIKHIRFIRCANDNKPNRDHVGSGRTASSAH